eukprot:gene17771-biopygen833
MWDQAEQRVPLKPGVLNGDVVEVRCRHVCDSCHACGATIPLIFPFGGACGAANRHPPVSPRFPSFGATECGCNSKVARGGFRVPANRTPGFEKAVSRDARWNHMVLVFLPGPRPRASPHQPSVAPPFPSRSPAPAAPAAALPAATLEPGRRRRTPEDPRDPRERGFAGA